jgi:hypothetical protein
MQTRGDWSAEGAKAVFQHLTYGGKEELALLRVIAWLRWILLPAAARGSSRLTSQTLGGRRVKDHTSRKRFERARAWHKTG